LSKSIDFVKTLNIYPNYRGVAMLSTLLMLACILAISWLRSDVKNPDTNAEKTLRSDLNHNLMTRLN
jgi:hypothetical protein